MNKVKKALYCRLVKDAWKKLSFWLLIGATALETWVYAVAQLSLDPSFTQWIPSGWQTWAFPVILFARVFTFVKPKEGK
jgi:hypothetical protein